MLTGYRQSRAGRLESLRSMGVQGAGDFSVGIAIYKWRSPPEWRR